jgi:streptomycin 6-kinase
MAPDPLDDVVAAAARHWRLTLGEQLAGGTRSAVYAATDPGGRDVVLKVPGALTDPIGVTAAEAAALTVWRHTGAAVGLVDVTFRALLLHRARPGTNAPWDPQESMDDLILVAAELLRRLWAADPGGYRFPDLSEVYSDAERVARRDAAYERRARAEPERGAAGLSRLPGARAAAQELIIGAPGSVLLHGDFRTKNLVRDTTAPAGWLCLDPLPMIGDPACEVAAFAAYLPAGLILPAAELLAIRAGVDAARARAWAAIWAVHQSAQAWRDDQDVLDRLVGSAEIGRLLRGPG